MAASAFFLFFASCSSFAFLVWADVDDAESAGAAATFGDEAFAGAADEAPVALVPEDADAEEAGAEGVATLAGAGAGVAAGAGVLAGGGFAGGVGVAAGAGF